MAGYQYKGKGIDPETRLIEENLRLARELDATTQLLQEERAKAARHENERKEVAHTRRAQLAQKAMEDMKAEAELLIPKIRAQHGYDPLAGRRRMREFHREEDLARAERVQAS
jgi:hypothetical protein